MHVGQVKIHIINPNQSRGNKIMNNKGSVKIKDKKTTKNKNFINHLNRD